MKKNIKGKVIIIDDEDDILLSISEILEHDGYICEKFHSAKDFLRSFTLDENENLPMCVLCDVKMPEINGFEFQTQFSRWAQYIPLVMISGSCSAREVVSAFHGGIVDFLVKPFELNELLSAVEKAIEKSRFYVIEAQNRLKIMEKIGTLTPREYEVLVHVRLNKTSSIIAEELDVGLRTVKLYRQRIMEKLSVSSSVELLNTTKFLDDINEQEESIQPVLPR